MDAATLNQALYSDVLSIPEYEVADFTEMLTTLCRLRKYPPAATENWLRRRYRLYLSLEWLDRLISRRGGEVIGLEMGEEGVVSDLLFQNFPLVQWKEFQGDLRYRWDCEDGCVDLLVCTDVLEYLADLPNGGQGAFLKTGLRGALSEAFRVLQPGGSLFITTPNGASLVHLQGLLAGSPSPFADQHVRAYTLAELCADLTALGFTIEESRTVHCLSHDHHYDYSPLFETLLRHQCDTGHRGDDLFIVAAKP